MSVVSGDPDVVAARELTKVHEEFIRGTASAVRQALAGRDLVRGEFTLVVGPVGEAAAEEVVDVASAVLALEARGVPRMEAIKQVARERGLGKREVYRAVEERR